MRREYDKACRGEDKPSKELRGCSTQCVRAWASAVSMEKSCRCNMTGEVCVDAFGSPLPGWLTADYQSVRVEKETGNWWYHMNGEWVSAGDASFLDAGKYVASVTQANLAWCLDGKRFWGIDLKTWKDSSGSYDYCDPKIVWVWHHLCLSGHYTQPDKALGE